MTGLTGTGALLWLALRRDRVQLPAWLVALTGIVAASASSVAALYDTDAARLSYATATAASPVARAFTARRRGRASGPSSWSRRTPPWRC
jgi:ABC-2 type transport system permease protein